MSQQRPSPRRGRRVAKKPTSRGVDRTAVGAVVVLVVAALAVSVATREPLEQEAAAASASQPVDSITTACPPRDAGTQVLSASAPLPGLGEGGAVRSGPPGRVAETPPQDVARGVLRTLDAPGDGPVAVAAEGRIAAGLFAATVASGRGQVTAAACPQPNARWWFTGAGGTLDHTSDLVLTNVDPGVAVVDLRVLGGDGQIVDAPGTRGITIEPGRSQRVSLLDVAPQLDDLAVRVTASRGRVVASMRDAYAASASQEPGTDHIPAQSVAARKVRLSGIPQQADSRTLVVGNPGNREALVDVQISGESGTFAPTEGAQVRVPPGSVTTADLPAPAGDEAVAIVLTSTSPVTATVRSTAGADVSYAATGVPLSGPAAAVLAPDAAGRVQLTAGPAAAVAEVASYTAEGEEVRTERLSLDPGATTTWRPGRQADYVVVRPRRGGVHGAVSISGGGISQLRLDPLPVRVEEPAVVPALG